jgi:hypothetical protein
MTNLLPVALRQRQAHRRILVLVGTLGVVAVSSALFVVAALTPAYLAASTEIKNIQARTVTPEKERALAIKKEKETVLALKKTTDALTALSQSGTGVAMIEKTLSVRPVGTLVTALTFTTRGATSTLILEGTAKTRDAVIEYVSTIEKLPGVVSAEVPITSLAKADDTTFNLTVTGNF